MTEVGLEKITIAKQDGSWNTLDKIEALIVPLDLKQALETNKTANRYFAQFSNTAKKNILFWVESAKRSETRLKRIELTVNAVAQNKNPLKPEKSFF